MMPTIQQPEQLKDLERHKLETLTALVGEQLIHALGKPGDLLGVQVRQLWENRYRVNVLVGLDAVSAKVAHSYFLVADSDGNIIAATPKITRQY